METNKIFAAILLAGVIAMTAGFVSELVIQPRHLEEDAYVIDTGAEPGEAERPAEPQIAAIGPLMQEADPASGEGLVRACQSCHTFEEGGANRVGPNLYGILGAPMAHAEGFNYSSGLQERAEEGGVWGYQELNAFLQGPREYVPGTAMSYAGMANDQDRADVIAYLRTLSNDPQPLPDPNLGVEQAAAPAEGGEGAAAGEEAPQEAGEEAAEPEGQTQVAEGEEAAEGGEPAATGVTAMLQDADPAAGESATRVCQACHTFNEGGPARVGPNLYGVVGAAMAHAEGFNYSDALQQRGEEGGAWGYEELDAFLQNPRGYIPGTNMSFAGVRDDQQRADLIAYLRTLSGDPEPLPGGGQ